MASMTTTPGIDLVGEVRLNDEPSNTKLHRFCQKKINQWLHAKGLEALPLIEDNPHIEFKVEISEEDGDSHQTSCETEISLGGAVWRGCDLACDAQQAFLHSLKRLQPH